MQIELVGHVHPLQLERREPLRRRLQVVDPRFGGLDEDVAALDDTVGEVGVLAEGEPGQVLVEALMLEDHAGRT